jgi:mRNA-degrading endonuclease RelE of RelBE toxin-antitoxin system
MLVFLSKSSRKYLAKLELGIRSKIVSAIERLPDEGDIKRMRGPCPLDTYRLRVGKYRVLYVWEKDTIRIVDIDSRGDIYK